MTHYFYKDPSTQNPSERLWELRFPPSIEQIGRTLLGVYYGDIAMTSLYLINLAVIDSLAKIELAILPPGSLARMAKLLRSSSFRPMTNAQLYTRRTDLRRINESCNHEEGETGPFTLIANCSFIKTFFSGPLSGSSSRPALTNRPR